MRPNRSRPPSFGRTRAAAASMSQPAVNRPAAVCPTRPVEADRGHRKRRGRPRAESERWASWKRRQRPARPLYAAQLCASPHDSMSAARSDFVPRAYVAAADWMPRWSARPKESRLATSAPKATAAEWSARSSRSARRRRGVWARAPEARRSTTGAAASDGCPVRATRSRARRHAHTRRARDTAGRAAAAAEAARGSSRCPLCTGPTWSGRGTACDASARDGRDRARDRSAAGRDRSTHTSELL